MRLALTLFLAVAQGYLLGDPDQTICWCKNLATGVQEMLQNCPEGVVEYWTTLPPSLMYAGDTYRVGYLTRLNINIASTPAILHANVHSCRDETGTCTPNVAQTPDLVTHTTALTSALPEDTRSVTFNADISLAKGSWTIIAHIRFKTSNTTQYDVAIGTKRNVKVKSEEQVINGAVVTAAQIAAAISIALLFAFGVVLAIRRVHPIIKAVSPHFYLGVIAHAIIGCIAVFLLDDPQDSKCRARPWLLSLAFSGLIGLLLPKNWRLYRIFSNQQLKVVRVSNKQLLSLYVVLVALDVVLLATWTGWDPLSRTLYRSASIDWQFGYHCDSRYAAQFLWALYLYKGAVVLLGLWVAYQARNVAPVFNESSLISVAMYTITIIGAVVVPLQYSISDQPTVVYALRAFGVLAVCTGVPCVLLGSKLLLAVREPEMRGVTGQKTSMAGSKSSFYEGSADQEAKAIVKGGKMKLPVPAVKLLMRTADLLKDVVKKNNDGLPLDAATMEPLAAALLQSSLLLCAPMPSSSSVSFSPASPSPAGANRATLRLPPSNVV